MVLGGRPPGRVGRRRISSLERPPRGGVRRFPAVGSFVLCRPRPIVPPAVRVVLRARLEPGRRGRVSHAPERRSRRPVVDPPRRGVARRPRALDRRRVRAAGRVVPATSRDAPIVRVTSGPATPAAGGRWWSGSAGRSTGRSGSGSRSGDRPVARRQLTAAEQRSMEVKRARGPRDPKPDRSTVEPPRGCARSGSTTVRSARRPRRRRDVPVRVRTTVTESPTPEPAKRQRTPGVLDPEVVSVVEREAGSQRAGRYQERLTTAAEALSRGRYDDARRMVQPVLRDLPNVAMAHEVAGLALYSTGQWRRAAAELEIARQLEQTVRHHPVLMDCYRAMRRYGTGSRTVGRAQGRLAGPRGDGRGSDRGRRARSPTRVICAARWRSWPRRRRLPKKVREHHLRQWYVLGDLHDRSGNVIEARRFFSLVAVGDAEFADVAPATGGARPLSRVGPAGCVTPLRYGDRRFPSPSPSFGRSPAGEVPMNIVVVAAVVWPQSHPIAVCRTAASCWSFDLSTPSEAGTLSVPVVWDVRRRSRRLAGRRGVARRRRVRRRFFRTAGGTQSRTEIVAVARLAGRSEGSPSARAWRTAWSALGPDDVATLRSGLGALSGAST